MPQRSQNGNFKLKFLVTSRPYGDIERRFANMTRQFPSIRLAGEDEWRGVSQEIDMVMNARVDEIIRERNLSRDIGDAEKRRLSMAENRTYVWLNLTLDFLRGFHGNTQAKILREIDRLPETVDQAYEKILQRCNSRYHGDGRRLLEIIVATHRPLDLSEIDLVLEIHEACRCFEDLDLEGPEKRKQWIRDVCGLFVSVIDSRLYLIQQTARELLLQEGPEPAAPGTWRRSIDLRHAHLLLAKLCITYLSFENFKMHDHDYDPDIPENAFSRYSAAHWTSHVRQGHSLGHGWVQKVIILCDKRGHSKYWTRYPTFDLGQMIPVVLSKKWSCLHWATFLDLTEVVHSLIDERNMKIDEDVIRAAVTNSGGGAEVLKLLLDRADIKITKRIIEIVASNMDYGEQMMQILFDQRGSEMRITEDIIYWAASNQPKGEAITKLLLDYRGADIKITTKVVYGAAFNFRNGGKVMKLLLNRGAEIQVADQVVEAAASFWPDRDEVMELLRRRRAADLRAGLSHLL
ncbi:uncharacterized protein N7496_009776 [Penicillium cataractarum]|uniref:DUF7069 domain-containing protein n=1 Tax=Penicillium cataractarum TaxID=2100454 RepID=A0A9W9RUF6_9EURO|nr:uncharacterized protein N7496_009776 [Penicillium cataractarum]KAJ5364063.1 hypothetical protein N7496_009776 [Penicillium cataractarum]